MSCFFHNKRLLKKGTLKAKAGIHPIRHMPLWLILALRMHGVPWTSLQRLASKGAPSLSNASSIPLCSFTFSVPRQNQGTRKISASFRRTCLVFGNPCCFPKLTWPKPPNGKAVGHLPCPLCPETSRGSLWRHSGSACPPCPPNRQARRIPKRRPHSPTISPQPR